MPENRENDFKRNNAFLLNDICARTPARGVMKSTIFVDPGHHYYILSKCEPCPGVEKNFFLRKTSILQFLPQHYLPIMVGIREIYNSLSLYL